MSYKFQQAPGLITDVDGLRKYVEEQLRNVGRSTEDMDVGINSVTAEVAKYSQFGRVTLTADQTGIVDSTRTNVNFNTVVANPSGIWNATTKRWKPTVAGYYRVSGILYMTWNTGTGFAFSIPHKNGVDYGRGSLGDSNGLPPYVSMWTDLVHFNGTTDEFGFFAFIAAASATTRSVTGLADGSTTMSSINLVKAD